LLANQRRASGVGSRLVERLSGEVAIAALEPGVDDRGRLASVPALT
jgi:hypothetical protein